MFRLRTAQESLNRSMDDTINTFDWFSSQLMAHQYYLKTGNRVQFEPPCPELVSHRYYLMSESPAEQAQLRIREQRLEADRARRSSVRSQAERDADREFFLEALAISDDDIKEALRHPIYIGSDINVRATANKHNIGYNRLLEYLKKQQRRTE